jgi:dihydropyrimidinase
MGDFLITSGTLVTDTETYDADIRVQGEKIVEIGPNLPKDDVEVIDAYGKLVLPGGIDPHTHFALPMFDTISSDDHYTGHKAAAIGGTTTVLDFVPQDYPTLEEAVENWHTKADNMAAIDFGFHMNITNLNFAIETEIPRLLYLGINTLKVFTAYNGRLRLQDGEIFRVMQLARDNGMLTMLHAENGDVIDILVADALTAGHTDPEWHALTRPGWGAVEAFFRGAALAVQAQAPLYVVHMNMAGEVDQLRYFRDQGMPIMGETCPQYLFFTIDDLRRPDGSKWICSPPMRSSADNESLWKGLVDGTIQTIGTDHCPFFYDGTQSIQYEGQEFKIAGKELGNEDFTKIPNGLPGVGDRLAVIWTHGVGTGKLTPSQFVSLTSTNSAKIFGLYPRKGALLPDSDADIVIWDPNRNVDYGVAHAQHRTDYNLYEGWKLLGFPERVFLRGNLIVDQGEWLGRPGMGQFIHRSGEASIL